MKPDSSRYNTDPEYIRGLVFSCQKLHRMTQQQVAAQVGVSDRVFRYYVTGQRHCSYAVQFALECLAADPAL